MKAAIPKIDRRIAEIDELLPHPITDPADPTIKALNGKLDALLTDIFGPDTVEYERYDRELHISLGFWHPGLTRQDIARMLQKGLLNAKGQLEAIRSGFHENLEDAGYSPGGRALRAYEGLELHPAIERAAGKLFRDGHYANAVEDSVKALNALVRLNSGVDDRDGSTLMEYVFAPKNPVLRFNDLQDDSDRDEQRGLMMLFSGAVTGIRNPRAHKLLRDDPERALEFIAFVSLLAKLADTAKKA
jgi:uncharacterized protein (TIGR02391 family)